MNTKRDLKRVVHEHLRDALDGQSIEKGGIRARLPHMLGIAELGEIHNPDDESGTILDPSVEFWQEYEESVRTKNAVTWEIEDVLEELSNEDVLTVTYENGNLLVEVGELDQGELQTTCSECGATTYTDPNLVQDSGQYYISVSIDCPDCGFSGKYRDLLLRV